MYKWATVVCLAMTPAIFLGQSAACAAGIGFDLNPWLLVPVVAAAGFGEGLLVVWLAVLAQRIERVRRLLARAHSPRATAWANRWGPAAGLALAPAFVGQEPILIALVWLDVRPRRLIVPLALSNAVYTGIYLVIVRYGWDQLAKLLS